MQVGRVKIAGDSELRTLALRVLRRVRADERLLERGREDLEGETDLDPDEVAGYLIVERIAKGVLPISLYTLTEAAIARVNLIGWLIQAVGLTTGTVAAAYAGVVAARAGTR